MMQVSPSPETIRRLLNQVIESCALLAGMQLDLFTPLQDGPLSTAQIAAATGTDPDRLERLLYVLVAAGLLTFQAGLFANTVESNTFLVRGRPTFMGGMHEFQLDLWQAALRTAESVRTGIPQAHHDFRYMAKHEQIAFFRGLHVGAKAEGAALAKRFDFSAHGTLLDIGGGSGGLAIALTQAYPQLEAIVVDLPEVVPVAEHFIREETATDRVQVLAVDAVDGSLDGQFDVVTMRAFTQVLSPIQIERALKNVDQVLKPGGAIYILAQVLDNSHLSPVNRLLIDLAMLNIYEHGRAYTEQEYRTWLTDAGFVDVERIEQPLNDILAARKPR